MTHRRAVACLVVASLLLWACREQPPEAGAAAPPVMVERATAHDVLDQIEATGQLLAKAEATVAAQVDGEITGIAADEGASVTLGQVIIEIDPRRRKLELDDAHATLAQTKAQLEEARRDLGRSERLAKSGASSQARLDERRTARELAQSRVLAAEARVGLAQRALEDASVKAPFAGLVARRHVNVGEFVTAGRELFELVALDPVEVEFFLAEVDSSRVSEGQTVEVRVASHPDEVFVGTVSVVSPTIDEESRTRRVKALVANPEGRLLPGTFARADLGVAERTGVVMVPKEAVVLRADGAVVFVLNTEGDRVERVSVEVGRHRGGLVEVRGGIDAGSWVVVRGQGSLVEGSPVSLRNEDGTAFSLPPTVGAQGG